MNQDFKLHEEWASAMHGLDEYDPVEAYERQGTDATNQENSAKGNASNTVSNDEFMAAIFGDSPDGGQPLVCRKRGDPDNGGWSPLPWPCDTTDPNNNWYALPSRFLPDVGGRYHAKKKFALSVHAVMIDDVGTKVSADRFISCPPSWAIETSPGNFQYGYIFAQPINDLDVADTLKESLIRSGLCDSGATGGVARWMRLPVGVNGRPRYGYPSPKCRLSQWQPDLRYTLDDLGVKLGLQWTQPVLGNNAAAQQPEKSPSDENTASDTAAVVKALKEKGLYKFDLGSGKHDITCPWVKGHTDGIDNGSAYFEPSPEYPTGGFKCHHSHGHLFHIRDLKAFLGLDDADEGSAQVSPPQKLPSALRAVPPLDPANLPDALKDAVIDMADRLQCPPDYLAVAMLCAAGAAVGNRVGIFPYANDESWEVYPALWGGTVGDPGSKKSPALKQALVPLQHLDSQAAQRYAQDMLIFEQATAQYEQAVKAWSTNKSVGLKPVPPAEPKRERYVVHDSTYQALGVILADNPRGVLALADELSGLLQSLDTPGQEAARGFYLTGWSGTGGYSFDRIGRGSITLDRFCLSVFGGFQPDRVKAYVQFSQRGSSKNDGLLQRFQLLVWPDPVGPFSLVDRAPDQAAINKYHQAVTCLPSLHQHSLVGARRLPNGSQLFHFSAAAQLVFNVWYVQNESLLTDGKLDPARQSHFAKYRSLVPALALLFHLLDGHSESVCEGCLTRALSMARYLKKHADRIYTSISGQDHAAVRSLAKRLLDGHLPGGFTCRTLILKGWTGLTTKEQAQSAIDALVEYGWLLEIEIRSGGRPTVKYTLNPGASADLL
jgi:hypothetical protein